MIYEKICGHIVEVLRSFKKYGKAGCKIMIWYILTGKKKKDVLATTLALVI